MLPLQSTYRNTRCCAQKTTKGSPATPFACREALPISCAACSLNGALVTWKIQQAKAVYAAFGFDFSTATQIDQINDKGRFNDDTALALH